MIKPRRLDSGIEATPLFDVNRYYSNVYGRFMTPDPYTGSAKPDNPGSWNRYAYGLDDPINEVDPTGLASNDCDKLLAKINRRVYGTKSDSLQPAKGLIERFMDQIYGDYAPGSGEWDLHNDIIAGVQRGLKELMKS